MKTPTPIEIELFFAHVYDPNKAHEYYLRTRELKGRQANASATSTKKSTGTDPRIGMTEAQIHQNARDKQRAELSQQINTLETKLAQLKIKIQKKISEEDAHKRKSLGKKERSAKEHTKPKTVAEKSKASRESKKYRDKNQQKLKTKAKAKSGSGTSTKSKSSTNDSTTSAAEITSLKALSTRVEGKIAVAKKKLAAL